VLNTFPINPKEGYQYGGQEDAEKVFIDLSYFANDALWDGFFFSSIAPLEGDTTFNEPDLSGKIVDPVEQFVAGTRKLNNPRMELFRTSEESDAQVQERLTTYDRSGARLFVDGSFNVNSTSVEAWRAFLGGLNDSELTFNGSGVGTLTVDKPAAFFRHVQPPNSSVLDGDYIDPETWRGYSVLDEDELDDLASKIVEQIRERTRERGGSTPQPFASLATFVNRLPNSSNDVHKARGLLQAAIDEAGINDALMDDAVERVDASLLDEGALNDLFDDGTTNQGTDFYKPFANQDFQLSSAAAAPGYLLQSDVLQALAPYLSVRSDTFRIRTYGEVLDPVTGESEGKAWLEAIVQRTPVPVVARSGSPDEPETVSSDLGRRYRIVKVNWLDEDQI
jgi:hypothetical protein